MKKSILLVANWCPVAKATRELFEKIKREKADFNYEYVDIDSEKDRKLVENFSVTDIPKTIFQDKIIFHGLPKKRN